MSRNSNPEDSVMLEMSWVQTRGEGFRSSTEVDNAHPPDWAASAV